MIADILRPYDINLGNPMSTCKERKHRNTMYNLNQLFSVIENQWIGQLQLLIYILIH